MNTTRHTTGTSYPSMAHWLAASSPQPRDVRTLWAQGQMATLISGRCWDTVEMPLALSGLTSTYLTYRSQHVGPHLLSGTEATAWWLVEAGAGQTLAGVEQVKVLPVGCPITAPAPSTYNGDRLWILPESPCPWLRLTSAEALRTAVDDAVRARPVTYRRTS
ncbi:hypothetical protein AB0I49_05095 [Streptomyces sp. NPDC050617]|uniref:hypothetical protein n=1 Tax=Streptomyces sp. NPDC050617 TaxID=3154628 RepID=UPI0034451DEA